MSPELAQAEPGIGDRIDARLLPLSRWTALCAAAEAIGMTAAAAAAKISQALLAEPGTARDRVLALSLVVAGGLVEGVALGACQAAGLGRLLPRLDLRRWLWVTVTVAGLGWAGASAPAVLSGSDTGAGTDPPLVLVIGGAAGLGVTMGALLGAAQARLLRGQVRQPSRWIAANVAAWCPAMSIIFLGATAPESDWSVLRVVSLGTLTGLAAGAVLGLVTGRWIPALDGPAGAPAAMSSASRTL
jgi:hypothetical protein